MKIDPFSILSPSLTTAGERDELMVTRISCHAHGKINKPEQDTNCIVFVTYFAVHLLKNACTVPDCFSGCFLHISFHRVKKNSFLLSISIIFITLLCFDGMKHMRLFLGCQYKAKSVFQSSHGACFHHFAKNGRGLSIAMPAPLRII